MTLRRYLLPILVALPLAAAPVLAQPVDAATAAEQPAAKRVSKGEQQALKWFAMLDANKDGRISRQEARVAFRLSPTLAEYFRDTDLDGDGYLTQQEIRTVAERRRAERPAAAPTGGRTGCCDARDCDQQGGRVHRAHASTLSLVFGRRQA